ncbi:hypothetical protein ElyMa_003675900 [Elysia marginata]|uniref:Uncharacterized protein n=1 Tax=Elysia marginata TaxID=1093978 RepID=A0AAV4EYV4_9GAST|nr:hypothetical protein ElyMa_003675900 [Elysia marginata]
MNQAPVPPPNRLFRLSHSSPFPIGFLMSAALPHTFNFKYLIRPRVIIRGPHFLDLSDHGLLLPTPNSSSMNLTYYYPEIVT